MSSAPELFSEDQVAAFLEHPSPLARRWAVETLRRAWGPSALPRALPLGLREKHPDVLQALAWWCEELDSEALFEPVFALAKRLKKALGRGHLPLASTLWDYTTDPERRKRLLDFAAPPRLKGEIPALLAALGGGGFEARMAALLAGDEDGELADRLYSFGPEDPAGAARWAFALCSRKKDVPRWMRWNVVASRLPARAEREEGEEDGGEGDGGEEPETVDLRPLAARLKSGADRLLAGPWEGAFGSPLGRRARRLLAEAGAVVSAVAEALEGRLAEGELPEPDLLARELEANIVWLKEAASDARSFREAPDAVSAAEVAALSVWPLDPALAEAIVSGLSPKERGELSERLCKALPAHLGERSRARALEVSGRLMGPPAAALLGAELGGSELISDTCVKGLKAMGPGVLEVLEPVLDGAEGPELSDLVEVFSAFPGERSGKMLAKRAGRLWSELEQWEAGEALEATGSAAALEALREAYRPGEPRLAEAILTLAELRSASLPEADALRRERAEEQGRAARRRSGQDAEDPVLVSVKCRRCGREYHHEVFEYRVAMDFWEKDRFEAMSFDRLLRCKHCGAVEDYDITESTGMLIWQEVEDSQAEGIEPETVASDEEGGPVARYGRVVMAKGFGVGRERVRSLREALARLLELTRKRPREAEGWRRLGNLYRRGGIADLAEEAYRRALELDPGEIESHASLAQVCLEAERLGDAHGHLLAVLRLAKGCGAPKRLVWEMVDFSLRWLADIHLAKGLPMLPDGEPPPSTADLEKLERELLRLTERYCGFERPR